MPLERRICGSVALWPKGSTLQPTVAMRPKRSRSQRCPYRPWRANDSPHGRLQSGSTHQPPTISQRPSATRRRISSNSSGSLSSTQASCATESQVKRSSGYSRMRSITDQKVARTA